jgi:hypothetical protein
MNNLTLVWTNPGKGRRQLYFCGRGQFLGHFHKWLDERTADLARHVDTSLLSQGPARQRFSIRRFSHNKDFILQAICGTVYRYDLIEKRGVNGHVRKYCYRNIWHTFLDTGRRATGFVNKLLPGDNVDDSSMWRTHLRLHLIAIFKDPVLLGKLCVGNAVAEENDKSFLSRPTHSYSLLRNSE